MANATTVAQASDSRASGTLAQRLIEGRSATAVTVGTLSVTAGSAADHGSHCASHSFHSAGHSDHCDGEGTAGTGPVAAAMITIPSEGPSTKLFIPQGSGTTSSMRRWRREMSIQLSKPVRGQRLQHFGEEFRRREVHVCTVLDNCLHNKLHKLA